MRLYILAMMDEAKEIIKDFELIQEKPFQLYKKENALLAITGVGKVNASFVLASVLKTEPNITEIINLGFAGAFGDYNIGDFVIVDEAIYHDFDLTMFNYKMGQVPNIKEDFITDNKYLTLFYDLKRTILYTGDYFLTKKLSNNFLVDMEATALYHVAYLSETPIFSIKVVSDIIGNKEHLKEYEDFEQNGSKYLLKLFNMIEVRLNEKGINFT